MQGTDERKERELEEEKGVFTGLLRFLQYQKSQAGLSATADLA